MEGEGSLFDTVIILVSHDIRINVCPVLPRPNNLNNITSLQAPPWFYLLQTLWNPGIEPDWSDIIGKVVRTPVYAMSARLSD